jgi:uncharacterized repeat protein (TIGR01451 family)
MPANITLVSAPSPQCGGGVSIAGNTLALTGATINGNATCTVTATVNATASASNTVQGNTFSSAQVVLPANNATATLNVTGGGGDFGMSKAALGSAAGQPTGSYGVTMPFQFQLNFSSIAGSVFAGGTFSDDLTTIAPATVIVDNGGSMTPTSTNCGTPVFTDTNGGTSISATGLAIPSGGTCTVKFWAQFTNTVGAAATGTNTATATFGGIPHSANATVTELPSLYVQNYTTSNQGLVNQPLTVAGQIRDDAGTSDTGAVAVFNLNGAAHPHSVVLASAPNFTFTGCPAGLTAANIAIDPSNEFFTVTVPGTINATCTIGYNVINEVSGAAGAGTFVSGNPTYAGALTGNLPKSTTGVGFAQFSTSNITPSKQFVPNNIQAGAPTTTQITLAVAGVFGGALQTIANNVTFPDTLPAGITFSPTPNPTFTGCGLAPAYVIAGSTITFSNITLTATGAASTTCTVQFQVTSTLVGAPPPNVIPAGDITTTSAAITNALAVQASLTVVNGIAVQKTFTSPSVAIGSTDLTRFLLSNSAATTPISGSLTDHLPATLQLNSLTVGGAQAGDAPLGGCGGSITAGTVGTGGAAVTLGSLTVPAYNNVTKVPGQCVVYLSLGASAAATPGTIASNTLNAGDVVLGGIANLVGSTASTTLTAAPNVGLAKAFAPTIIAAGASSVLTISVINTAANSAQLTGLGLTDALPANVTIAAVPNASTTCTGGTVTAVAGASTITLSGGSVASNATCTVSVSVTGTVSGIYTNTIPASNVTSTQNATNSAPASAVLNIGNVSGVTLAKSFTPALIAAGGTSVLQITVNNTMAGAVPLTAVQLNDTLPGNVVVAPVPAASTTCGAGVVSAVAGGTVVGLAGGSVGAGASCTITVSVTSATSGIYLNTIPAGALSDAQGSDNAAPAQATLNVGNTSGVGIAKAFSPTAIPAGGTSVLTISVLNDAASAVALSAMGLTDTLPANVVVAPVPNASTTCAGGTVGAVPAAGVVTLTGGSVAANASCTVAVSVTSATAGVYTNTIPANALTDAQASTNTLPASAILNVANASGVGLTKAFAPAVIAPGATSVLTIALANTQANAVALSALTFVDNLPANVTIASTPNASTTCAGGTAAAVAGGSLVTLSGAAMAVNATCTVTVAVTGTVPGTYTNTIPAGAIGTAQGATNGTQAQADLIIGQPSLTLTKTSAPSATSVSPGESITYTIVLKNGGTQPETNAHISDTLTNATLTSGSVTVNGQAEPDAVVTNGQPFGTIAVGATTTIVYTATVNLTAATGSLVTNTATVLGDQPCTVGSCTSASAANTVSPPVLSVTKTIDGQTTESVLSGQTVTYGVTISNTGTSPAVNTTVTDNIPAGVAAIPGTVTLNGAPLASATISGQTLTIPVNQVAAGKSSLVTFNAKVGPTAGSAANVVSVLAAGLASAAESNVAMAHQVPATITVTKTASATTATVGDRVDYQIVIAPVGGVGYGATIVADTLPAGEVYAPGTARVNGKPSEPTVDGRTLIWTLPALGSQDTFTYATVIAPGVQGNSTLTNTVAVTAVAPGGAGLGRGSASASVLVTASNFASCYPITGRVYLDAYGSGRFQDPDVGLGGVHIYLDDGESVVTDTYGRYDFPCVHPGMHALRLDETTLPPGAVPYDDRNIDSEKSTRRLIHHIYDTTIIEDINFAVTGSLRGSPAPLPDCCSAKGPPK